MFFFRCEWFRCGFFFGKGHLKGVHSIVKIGNKNVKRFAHNLQKMVLNNVI